MADAQVALEGALDYRSVALAQHDSSPSIRIEFGGRPCAFTIDFAAGTDRPERSVLRIEGPGEYRAEQIRRGERLFARSAIPVGHPINVFVKWDPAQERP